VYAKRTQGRDGEPSDVRVSDAREWRKLRIERYNEALRPSAISAGLPDGRAAQA